MSSIGVGELVENVVILAGGFSREQISSEMTFIAKEIHTNPRSIPVTVVLTTLLLGLVRGRAPRARSLRCVCCCRCCSWEGERLAESVSARSSSSSDSDSSRSGLHLAFKAAVTVRRRDCPCHVCCYIMIPTAVRGHFHYVIVLVEFNEAKALISAHIFITCSQLHVINMWCAEMSFRTTPIYVIFIMRDVLDMNWD